MEKIPHGRYTKELRGGPPVATGGRPLCRRSSPATIIAEKHSRDLGASSQAGKLGNIGKNRRPLTEVEIELAKTKRELAVVRMERDILKRATAYFARESLPGTR